MTNIETDKLAESGNDVNPIKTIIKASPYMQSYERLLLENKAWAAEKVADDPDFFNRLANLQRPDFLWIGCSDSRVPANEITGTQPGEIFVHRNVANLVVNTDVNLLSVVDYAVNHLNVKHIIVCGHYGCGGVQAAMTKRDYKPVLNMWLRNIKDVIRLHEDELNAIENMEQRVDRLVELNVIEQVKNLARKSSIQRAWRASGYPHLHGWVYGLKDGLINTVFEMPAGSPVDPIYELDDL
ncbi:MAG: carbonic anhydrase [Chitinophagaceae bacterium]|nr:carbonic anhydrase [Chitinophagaceae bacterium]